MIYDTFRKAIAYTAELTPNAFLPKLGNRMALGKLSVHDCAELYLVARFLFATALGTLLPKSLTLIWVVGVIQNRT